MKSTVKRLVASVLSALMVFQTAQLTMAYAADAVDRAVNPAEQLELSVPVELQDGESYIFFGHTAYLLSENSKEKTYIPIQRTGDLSEEADVTVKLVDLTSHYGENYTFSIYKEKIEPVMEYGDVSIVDMVQTADYIEEIESSTEEEVGQILYANGGADIVDKDENVVGRITAIPLDEDGNPIEEDADEIASYRAEPEEPVAVDPADVDYGDGAAAELRELRNRYTGTVSDRQEMASLNDFFFPAEEEEAQEETPQLADENFPGKEFRLHFDAGEEAKYLVVTPKYSEKNDGSSEFFVLLRDASEGYDIPDDFFMTDVTIFDEDEADPIIINMKETELEAEDGYAYITVTRSGSVNQIVGVNLTSWDGSAEVNVDYGGVGADLFFPMGVTERTVKLPVGYGAEAKDFYVTLNTIENYPCTIVKPTAHVVIPAAEIDPEAVLQDGVKLTEVINLKNQCTGYGGEDMLFYNNDYSFKSSTPEDKEWTAAKLSLILMDSYAYDGIGLGFSTFLNWADGTMSIVSYDYRNPDSTRNETIIDMPDGYTKDRTAYHYFGQAETPACLDFIAYNTENHFSWVRECSVTMILDEVRYILRNFNFTVEDPEPKPLLGGGTLNQGFLVGDSVKRNFTITAGDNFTLNQLATTDTARLVGIEIRKANANEWVRLDANGNGESGSITYVLSASGIDALEKDGYISWTAGDEKGSLEGNITIRPVFDYVDVGVELKDSQYGTLSVGSDQTVFHAGDVLDFSTSITETGKLAGLSPAGVSYRLYDAKNGVLINDVDSTNYINGSLDFALSTYGQDGTTRGYYYVFEPTFTATDNQVVVQVAEDDLAYFDQNTGIFATEDKWLDNGTWNYRVAKDVLSNEIIEMLASTLDESAVPVWKIPGNAARYSGTAFYINTGIRPEDNLVTLSVDTDEDAHAKYVVSGALYTRMMNLAFGTETKITKPVRNVPVRSGIYVALTDDEGAFTIPPQTLVGETSLRYLVSFNGSTRIEEAALPNALARAKSIQYIDVQTADWATVDAIEVAGQYPIVPAWSPNSVHFTSVEVYQESLISNVINALEMTGKEVTITLGVEEGQPYAYQNETLYEHIVDVEMFFMNPNNLEVHGRYALTDEGLTYTEEDGKVTSVTLNFDKFTPDNPEEYQAGDVLYAQIVTDRKTDEVSEYCIYNTVSTGVQIFSDLDYEPETFELDTGNLASFFQVSTDPNGTHYTFGEFPFMGEITAAIKTFNFIKKASKYSPAAAAAEEILEELDEMGGSFDGNDSFDSDVDADDGIEDYNNEAAYDYDVNAEAEDNGLKSGDGSYLLQDITMSIVIDVTQTLYGAVRFRVAVVFSKGWGKSEKELHPYKSYKNVLNYSSMFLNGANAVPKPESLAQDLLYTGEDIYRDQKKSEFTGGYITFGIYVGVYLDYGFIHASSREGESSVDTESFIPCFMGAGGFAGAQIKAGYTGLAPWLPILYYNVEASGKVTAFFGEGADPTKTLESFKDTKHHSMGADFDFVWEIRGRVTLSGTLGVGLYKSLGARATVELGMDFGYSEQMLTWVPLAGSAWGLATDFTVSGTVDCVFFSIPLFSYSWALPLNYGWGGFIQEIERAKRCLQIVEKKIEKGNGSAAARKECLDLIDVVYDIMENASGTQEDLHKAWKAVQSCAYKNGLINGAENIFIDLLRAGGLGGAIENLVLMDDSTQRVYYVRDHVDSKWVADENGDLMGAFAPVHTETLMENAYAQPSTRLMALGGNRFLMVFLDDDNDRDPLQAAALMWTVYDANDNTFTEPQKVQDDGTADSKPFLADAGDKVVLAWASADPVKYENLLEETSDALAEKIGVTPIDEHIQEELEADPTILTDLMEIYSVEFDKDSMSFGEIEQLTDDEFYDDTPQVIYDDESGDYIVLYTKTALESDDYESVNEKIVDLINPYGDPDRNYSVIVYMIHNAENNGGDDTEAGWVRDYLYESERNDSIVEYGVDQFLEDFGGQRFLSSVIVDEYGEMIDPPISDLTVADGYNGFGAFAFTVDTDLNTETTKDRELYVQFYDFKDHSTYVPVKIAGDITTYDIDIPNRFASGYSIYEKTEAVEVSRPRLIRSGGSTWIFWCENDDGIRYLNLSALLNAKVSDHDYEYYIENGYTDAEIEAEARYALHDDGTIDDAYELPILKVDFGSNLNSNELCVTDYQVITDADDDLYVVWTDTTTDVVPSDVLEDMYVEKTSLEIYATAMIKDPDAAQTYRDSETGKDVTADTIRWSKPYRLTRDNKYHDGVAIALMDDGSLLVAHNEYDMLFADTEEKLEELYREGRISIVTEDGESHWTGSPYYTSDIALQLTHCDPVGSLEATKFEFSDDNPVPGETITVKAVIENVGLTAAQGCDVTIYAVKDGQVVGDALTTLTSDDIIYVNTAKQAMFRWTVPAEGADGWGFMARIEEKKADGGTYDSVESYSEVFYTAPKFDITVDKFEQNGDAFDVEYTVTNTGNAPAAEGTRADLTLEALYGDLKGQYGMDDDLLIEVDVSGLAPRESRTIKQTITLPVSVFELCGYDAVVAAVMDADDESYINSEQYFIKMDEPMNLTINKGEAVRVKAGEILEIPIDFDSNAFIKGSETILYTVEDTSIATVDQDGRVTGISEGETVLTATLLVSGRSVSVPLIVSGTAVPKDNDQDDWTIILPGLYEYWRRTNAANAQNNNMTETTKPETIPETIPETPAETVDVTKLFTDVAEDAWYLDAVEWAVENGIMNGVGGGRFDPDGTTTRAMVVTMLWRLEGEPEASRAAGFADVPADTWYTEAVAWAAENGIVPGYDADTFGPDDPVTREQLATILYRYAKDKGYGFTGFWSFRLDFDDADEVSDWAYEAMCWMVMEGVIQGMGNNKLAPKSNATRAQVAAMLMRYCAVVKSYEQAKTQPESASATLARKDSAALN